MLSLLAVTLFAKSIQPAYASDLCASTGSPFGPFPLETYEDGNYKVTYARALELAGFNALFPEIPSFSLPTMETGPRSAGSSQGVAPYIPPVLLKATAWLESGWAQADYSVPYGAVGGVLASHDCGYGIMQVTSGMQNISGLPSLDQAMIGGHYAFNIARGARILAEKWNLSPEYRPIVGARNSGLIEDWYYALWGYNGFAFKNHPLNPAYNSARSPYSCNLSDGFGHDRSQYPYQELIMGCAARPPWKSGTQLWPPQETHLPNLADPAFAGPLSLNNWNPCAFYLQCAAMDIPTPNTYHSDPTTATVTRAQVIGTPVASIAPGQVGLAATPGADSLPVNVSIGNSGTGPLSWYVTTSASWIRTSRFQGISMGTDFAGATPQTLKVWASGANLAPGTHTGSITIQSLYGAGLPVTIPVTVTVSLQVPKEVGDFNGDGKADLIYLCCGDTAAVWLTGSNGAVTAKSFTPWPGYNLSSGAFKAADFTGDGKTDILHLCCVDYGHLWTAKGDGTFSVSVFKPWSGYGMRAGTWLTGDFNGDNRIDLAHMCCQSYGHIWTSVPGGFSGSFFSPWSGYGVQSGFWRVGDVGGDARDDLVHFCCGDYAHTWTAVNGGFTPASVQPGPGYPLQSGTWIGGDFNGDGRTDFAHFVQGQDARFWVANGTGGFTVSNYRPWAGYGMYGPFRAGDFNGDGKTDIAHFCCGTYMHVWLSTGNNFSVSAFAPWQGYFLDIGSWEAGDFSGDGRTDFLHIPGSYVHTWTSLGDGRFAVGLFRP